jgi:TetR/AcrR family transcriptional repressor of uid operon
MARRTEDGGRERVVTTARSLFQQKGFHQTAMAELSEKAGISVGQIYRLFANKGEMIAAIIDDDADALICRLAAIRDAVARGEQTAREGFRQAVLQAMSADNEALTFDILAEGFRNPVVNCTIGILCDRYRTMLREIILSADPSLQGARLMAAEEIMLALLFGLGNRTLSRPQLSVEDTADHAADLILHMLAR